ncbi:hypothetical protein LZG74_11970 [Dyadobacter sp. CY327]|uniref:hypothetical protein n=1 Tax=Dyadobacter sp. CY327 TaxID=2907301 RepID=UPI001F3AF0F6|nr:hypothetical protein [Dyadobacter sp. CY327]MCE7071025.1 hypothetical protein [Dyadobacter sp. CY327]
MTERTKIQFLNLIGSQSLVDQTKKQSAFLQTFTRWSWLAVFAAAFLQLLIFWSVENFFAVCCIIAAWSLTYIFIISSNNFNKYSLSTFLITGFALTQYVFPTVFTLMEGKPLVYNLKYPYEVFLHSLLALAVLILTHSIYKKIYPSRVKSSIQSFLRKREFFKTPANSEIWLMGIIGLTSMFVTYFFNKQSYELKTEGAGNHFIEGLIPFSYAPYFILIKKLYSAEEPNLKGYAVKIMVFTAIIFAVGVGGNARSLFITGIVSAAMGCFLGMLLGKFQYKLVTGRNILIVTLAVWLVTGPLSDIGTAMVIVRQQRGSISKTEMLLKTLDVFEDKKALRIYKRANAATNQDILYDEHYFDNIFLARFCNLKFNDSSLEQFHKIGVADNQVQEYSIDKIYAELPQPILNMLEINIDKEAIIGSSFGDFLIYRAGGGNAVLGGYTLGQFAGTGMAAFGWWYLLFLGLGMLPIFFLLDLFVIVARNRGQKSGITLISLAGLLPISTIFMFLSLSTVSESVANLFSFIVRGWIQMVILYWIMYFLARKFNFVLSKMFALR